MILDLIALENTSRVWLYQADRDLTYDELDDVREDIFNFLGSWTAHAAELHTYGNVFHRRFLGLFVDETASAGASGCSIDSSVRFVQELGGKYGINFFDRMSYDYMDEKEEIHFINHTEMPEAYKNGVIDDNTLFFNHLVKSKGEFLKSWLVPLKESWHFKFV